MQELVASDNGGKSRSCPWFWWEEVNGFYIRQDQSSQFDLSLKPRRLPLLPSNSPNPTEDGDTKLGLSRAGHGEGARAPLSGGIVPRLLTGLRVADVCLAAGEPARLLSLCVSDDRSKGGLLSSPRRRSPMGKTLDSPSSCVSVGRYVSPLRVSAEQESEAREAERLLHAIAERYDDCFLRLRDATAEVADLRLERLHLRAENMQLSLLLDELEAYKGKQACAVEPALPPKPAEEAAARSGAPKSISIRSRCYLSQMKQPQGEAEAQRLLVRPPPAIVEAGEDEAKGDGEVEVEAYRQGTQKTELCNKWESGACPYADRCRFAHGLQEMRPVIRHPRYKTLPCQMMAAASGCPYGHRCHFRHSPGPATESY